MTWKQKSSLGGVVVATVLGVTLLKTLTVSPPSIRLMWNDDQAKWGKEFKVWQGQDVRNITQLVTRVLTVTNTTVTNFSIDLPRTNDRMFYRVSASWRN